MAKEEEFEGEEGFIDPVAQRPGYDDTESKIAILGHPIHAMSVAFPDRARLLHAGRGPVLLVDGRSFWARAAIWAAGTGFLFGMFSGFSGTAEILFVPGIRARAPAWTHFIIAVVALALLGANWGHRLTGYEEAVLPWGLLLSTVTVLVVSVTGWHGGKLVFDYRLGTSKGK
jgi:uncharacterized membrane protein